MRADGWIMGAGHSLCVFLGVFGMMLVRSSASLCSIGCMGLPSRRSPISSNAELSPAADNILPVVLQIRAAGVRTPRGGEWQAVQVKRAMERRRVTA